MSLDIKFEFTMRTDTMAVFDPEIVNRRKNDENWWSYETPTEMSEGFISLLQLERNVVYRVHVTEDLTTEEKNSAIDTVGPFGVESTSGSIFIGGAEYLPANEQAFDWSLIGPEEGMIIDLAPGEYDLHFFALKKSQTLVDLVIVVTQRDHQFIGLPPAQLLDFTSQHLLFPDEQNKVA